LGETGGDEKGEENGHDKAQSFHDAPSLKGCAASK